MDIQMWSENCDWNPVHRMAHVAFPHGRYIVIVYGYSVVGDEEANTTYEFDQSCIALYDILENKHHICHAVVDERSCREYQIEPSALATSGSAVAWQDSLLFLFAGFSIYHRRSTNYLSYIDFLQGKTLTARVISGGLGTKEKPVPTYRDKCSMNYWEKQLFVFGGYGYRPSEIIDENPDALGHYLNGNGKFIVNYNDTDERSWNNQLLVYDLHTHAWSSPTNSGRIPSPRAAHATCIVKDTLYLFGGRTDSSIVGIKRLNDLYSLALPYLEWTEVTLNGDIPCGRSWITLNALSSDCLLLVGGLDARNHPLSDTFAITLGEKQQSPSCSVVSRRVYPNPSVIDGGARLWHTSTTAFDGCVYSIGGCSSNLFTDAAKIQTQIDRYHVMRPMSLFKQCLCAVVKYKIRDHHLLPATLVSLLDSLNGGG